MQKQYIPGYHARGSRAPSKHCRPEYRPDQYEQRYTPSWSQSFPQGTMTQRVRQYTTKNCLAEIGNKCIRRCRKLRTREMEKKKKSFERGVYEDAPGKKQWPWRCEASPSSLYASQPQSHTLLHSRFFYVNPPHLSQFLLWPLSIRRRYFCLLLKPSSFPCIFK